MAKLHILEKITKAISSKIGGVLEERDATEKVILKSMLGDRVTPAVASDIKTIMETAQARCDELLEEIESRIISRKVDGVFLPPGKGRIITGSGKGLEKPPHCELLKPFIAVLHSQGIYFDDICIIRGDAPQHTVRTQPYCVVDIPRIHCRVLVCNEKNEATFVIKSKHITMSDLLVMDKAELAQWDGVKEIEWRTKAQWEKDIIAALFGETGTEAPHRGPKINIRTREDIRRAVLASECIIDGKIITDPATWLEISMGRLKRVQIGNKGLRACVILFEIATDPYTMRGFAELGRALFQDSSQMQEGTELRKQYDFEVADDEEQRKLMREDFWNGNVQLNGKIVNSPTIWIQLVRKDINHLQSYRRGVKAIATLFHIRDYPHHSRHISMLLGMVLFQGHPEFDQNPDLRAMYEFETANHKRQKILTHTAVTKGKLLFEGVPIVTPETWIAIPSRERSKIHLFNWGIKSLATIFGIPGNPQVQNAAFARLGLDLFQGHPQLQQDSDTKKYYDFEIAWLALPVRKRNAMSLFGKNIAFVTRLFGISEDPYKQETQEKLSDVLFP